LEESVRTNRVKIRSERTIAEMTTFVFRNGRPDHMVGYHDDLLWGLAMGLYVASTTFKEMERNKNKSAAIMDSWMTTTTQNEHIDSIKPAGEKMALSKPPSNTPEHMTQRFPNPMDPFTSQGQDGRHMYKEYGWLFGNMGRGRRP